MTGSPEQPRRLAWSLERLGRIDGLGVLEIGCGAGVAIAAMLRSSNPKRLCGVDRSAIAIHRARSRNATDMGAGRVDFVHSEFEDLPPQSWDRVLAVNVNAFCRRPEPSLQALRRLLAPDGRFLLAYEAPGADRAAQIADRLASAGAAGLVLDPAVRDDRLVGVAGRAL